MPCFVVAIFKWDCYVSQRHNISQVLLWLFFQVSFSMSIGHAMPMRPNKAQTAVHRCLTSAQLIWLCICLWWWPHHGTCISICPPYFLHFFEINSFIHPISFLGQRGNPKDCWEIEYFWSFQHAVSSQKQQHHGTFWTKWINYFISLFSRETLII